MPLWIRSDPEMSCRSAVAGNAMNTLQRGLLALKEIGPIKLLQLAAYRISLSSGILRVRTPVRSWQDRALNTVLHRDTPFDTESYGRYKHTHCAISTSKDIGEGLTSLLNSQRKNLEAQAERILEGVFPAYGSLNVSMGFPPDWHAFVPLGNADPSMRSGAKCHWTQYDVLAMPADVKLLWELSRFTWVYPLVRAYAASNDLRYIEGCLTLIKDWMRHNPPNMGPQWMSAQEAALRVLACGFLIQGAGSALNALDWETLALFMDAHAQRIPPTLSYARAQNNNHLLVEAAALFTVGVLFPEFVQSKVWQSLGRRELERGFRQQVFIDGGYVQHSHTYARLALEIGLWSVFLGRESRQPLSGDLELRLMKLARSLYAMMDIQSGRMPNFGPNDGVHARPLSTCEAFDFRPVIQAAFLILEGKSALPSGGWDEEAYWLGWDGEVDGDGLAEEPAHALPHAGLYRLGDPASWAVLRCAAYHSRPGHADQLHVDVWHEGMNLLPDPGTYLYNAEPPWENALMSAHVHNTAWLAGEEPMRRAGRFLWLDWDQGRLLGWWRSPEGNLEAICGEHHGCERRFLHRRTLVRLARAGWLVLDDFLGHGSASIATGWNLAGEGWQLQGSRAFNPAISLSLDFGVNSSDLTLLRGGEVEKGPPISDHNIQGWISPTYARKRACTRVVRTLEDILPLRDVVWVMLEGHAIKEAKLEWRTISGEQPSLRSLEWEHERMDIADAYLINSPGLRSAG